MLLIILLIISLTFGVEGYLITEVNGSLGSFSLKKEIKRKVYITKDALITETEREFMVQKVENGRPKIYRVIKSTKSYMDFSKMAPLFLVSLPFVDCEKRVCKLNKDSFKPTNEYRKIGKYKARKVIVKTSFMGENQEIIQWYTKEWKELIEANTLENEFYINFIKAIMKEMNLSEKNIPLKEIKNFLGYIVREFGGVIRTEQRKVFLTYSQVIEVRKISIPDYIYRLPEGYKKIR
ncbi:hypothetical protein JCM9492_05280 [Aquifex pyrophilus]